MRNIKIYENYDTFNPFKIAGNAISELRHAYDTIVFQAAQG